MKKWLLGMMAAVMAVSLAACTPTTEKQKEETTTVSAENSEPAVVPTTGGASDKVPDPNVEPVAVISIYHKGDGDSLVQEMDSLDDDDLNAQALVDRMIGYGVFTEGTEVIAFDKTGTLTKGEPAVITFENAGAGLTDEEILDLATALAVRNDHPVSKAVSDYSAQQKPTAQKEVHGFYAAPGQGVIGEIDGTEYYLGNIKGLDKFYLNGPAVRAKVSELADHGYTPLIFASAKKVLAYFGVADSIKENAPEVIGQLKGLGVKTIMLTGDNEKAARQIAEKVGVDRAKGNLLPEDKQSLVDSIAKREVIGMVGDGINDAPALARADIGFAMGAAGTDTAIETADVALMDDDLRKLPEFIKLSKKTFRLLVENIVIALSIKLIFFVLTLAGIGTMWMAVFADTGTCLIVVANGLRMLRWRG